MARGGSQRQPSVLVGGRTAAVLHPTGTNPLVRSAVRARPIVASGPADEPFAAYSSADMLMPAYFTGTAPLATPDQIVFVLGDFRGDVWIRDLD